MLRLVEQQDRRIDLRGIFVNAAGVVIGQRAVMRIAPMPVILQRPGDQGVPVHIDIILIQRLGIQQGETGLARSGMQGLRVDGLQYDFGTVRPIRHQ